VTAEPGAFRFGSFELDLRERRLRREGEPVELNARYLDALALMLREAGKLVSKDRFMDEVWRGVPVTDEALTQCIKMLRRQLGDEAARPRFIETVPKHGYRFIAAVEPVEDVPVVATMPAAGAEPETESPWRRVLSIGATGTAGAGLAGLIGGLFYGFGLAAQPVGGGGVGAASVLLVLLCVACGVALIGGAGVAFGVAAAALAARRPWLWHVLGGASGGMIVGGIVKLVGVDGFSVLLGQSPGDITGAPEGAVLGAAVGLGAWLGTRAPGRLSVQHCATIAAVAGGAAGVLITLIGGRLLGGSLDLLARGFPNSQLRLDTLGALFGETSFGPVSHTLTAAMEGALFAGCLVGGMMLARRRLAEASARMPPGG